MTTPNEFFTQALIAQAQAYAVLVTLLEKLDLLPPGIVRGALDLLIENSEDAPAERLTALNEILRQLALQRPG